MLLRSISPIAPLLASKAGMLGLRTPRRQREARLEDEEEQGHHDAGGEDEEVRTPVGGMGEGDRDAEQGGEEQRQTEQTDEQHQPLPPPRPLAFGPLAFGALGRGSPGIGARRSSLRLLRGRRNGVLAAGLRRPRQRL